MSDLSAGSAPTLDVPALARGLFDDAAIFPPGNAPMADALARHREHLAAPYAALVGPFVCSDVRWAELTAALAAGAGPLDVSLVVTGGAPAVIGAVRDALATPDVRLVGVEVTVGGVTPGLSDVARTLSALRDAGPPPGCRSFVEVPLGRDRDAVLDGLVGSSVYAKLRTGGTTAAAFPDELCLAQALLACTARGLPFKLTAGLHKAVRHRDPRTGFEHHGFLNVILAVAAGGSGATVRAMAELLQLQAPDAVASAVDRLRPEQVDRARRLFVSFGTCSIEEPVVDLESLRLLSRRGEAVTTAATSTTRPTPAPHGWLRLAGDDLFGLHNLPYGSFTTAANPRPRVGVAVGGRVLDLGTAARRLLPGRAELVAGGTLDGLLAAGPDVWSEVRASITGWFTDEQFREVVEPLLVPVSDAVMRLPFTVADYVDYYASEYHAANLGRIFRPGSEPLTPNWKHLPIGYHGRAGTVVVSGTPVVRPAGQRRTPEGDVVFGPEPRLDIEAELGFVVGTPSEPGCGVRLTDFDRHVFGVCIVNDWSARSIQAWEYAPLGPFLGKSFATSISPWVVPLAALEAARARPPARDPELLPYLDDRTTEAWGLDIAFEVRLNGEVVSRPPFHAMYWTGAQMLAHMTVNGASLRTGDLYASGTISGPEPAERGALIELTWNGRDPISLSDGSTRTFLRDGDEVVISAVAPGPSGTRIGLGEVRGTIAPGRPVAG